MSDLHPDTEAHFANCIDCHRDRYATPGMTAGEFARLLPDHLKAPYWERKLSEYLDGALA